MWRMWRIFASGNYVILGPGIGLVHVRRLAITWTDADLLSIGDLWIDFEKFESRYVWDLNVLTHWGRVTHICVSKLTTISSDNGLSPGGRQAIIWTNAEILLMNPWE